MAEFIVELLAFVLVIFVLYRWVKPLVQQMVRDRQDQIQQQVEASEEATRRLQDAERRFEHAEAEARKEVAKIRDDARADATQISEELREQADREVERIRQRGQEQLVAQRDLMVRGLRAELGQQSMRLAERIVTDTLADDRRKSVTVDGFLSDLEAMVPRTGAVTATTGAATTGGGAR
jgi:ATP synthase F0 subunit b